jgi:hypothetical protein
MVQQTQHTVFTAGPGRMTVSAICRRLQTLGYHNIITRNRDELDLLDQPATECFFQSTNVDQIYRAAENRGEFLHKGEILSAWARSSLRKKKSAFTTQIMSGAEFLNGR